MKIYVPDYYNEFKCIAGKCEDTCCAGWEVDVDEESYQVYRKTGGDIGKRLQSVMIPGKEGEGCSFRLTQDKRCPFLNDKNLCDIYTELGEKALCDTCTYFPRFVHDYGSFREMGPAPSCFSAAQLMVKKHGETQLVSYEDMNIQIQPNDICPEAFIILKGFRKDIFDVLWNRSSEKELDRRLIKILDKAVTLQPELQEIFVAYKEETEGNNSTEYGSDNTGPAYSSAGTGSVRNNISGDIISLWLSPFKGMEVINKDWGELLKIHDEFYRSYPEKDNMSRVYSEFMEECIFAESAFEQFLFYYFFRYVLESVYDAKLVCAVKTGIVAYLTVKRLCAAVYKIKGSLSMDEMADIFHVYSRHTEHSDINFGFYRNAYDHEPVYSRDVLQRILDKEMREHSE